MFIFHPPFYIQAAWGPSNEFYKYAGINNYFHGSCIVAPTYSICLFFLPCLREGSGVPAVAGNTSRPAYYRWDNEGDPPQPQGEEDCAGVCRKTGHRITAPCGLSISDPSALLRLLMATRLSCFRSLGTFHFSCLLYTSPSPRD